MALLREIDLSGTGAEFERLGRVAHCFSMKADGRDIQGRWEITNQSSVFALQVNKKLLKFTAMQKSDMIDEIVKRLEKQAGLDTLMWIFPNFDQVRKNIEHEQKLKLEASKHKHIVVRERKVSDESQLPHHEEHIHGKKAFAAIGSMPVNHYDPRTCPINGRAKLAKRRTPESFSDHETSSGIRIGKKRRRFKAN